VLSNGHDEPPKTAPSCGWISTPSNTWFLAPTWVSLPPPFPKNSISIGLTVFVGLTNVTNRQTDTHTQADRQLYSVCNNNLHLLITGPHTHSVGGPTSNGHWRAGRAHGRTACRPPGVSAVGRPTLHGRPVR